MKRAEKEISERSRGNGRIVSRKPKKQFKESERTVNNVNCQREVSGF